MSAGQKVEVKKAGSPDSREAQVETADWLKNSSFVNISVETSDSKRVDEINSTDIRDNFREAASKPSATPSPNPRPSKNAKSLECFNFYIDKSGCSGYVRLPTLVSGSAPRYHRIKKSSEKATKRKRYFKCKLPADNLNDNNQILPQPSDFSVPPMNDVTGWIEYITRNDKLGYGASNPGTREKLILFENVLKHNPTNRQLCRMYVNCLESSTVSYSEATAKLQQLLKSDERNVLVWNALIHLTQTSMTSCRVPDILVLYAKAMKKVLRWTDTEDTGGPLRIFCNLALFLRQSGMSEKFFTLIKISLQMNFPNEEADFLKSNGSNENSLVELEETILTSGLPMNELWMRIEKLRQSILFLPSATANSSKDPDRIVLNEDVYEYVSITQEFGSFSMALMVLNLLKIPISTMSNIHNRPEFKYEKHYELDCLEHFLPVLIHNFHTCSHIHKFDETLNTIIRELTNGPSYVNNIGFETYLETIKGFILFFIRCFKAVENKRRVFVHVWIRLLRLLTISKKLSSTLEKSFVNETRSHLKLLLKEDENRNVITFFVEFGVLEYEFGHIKEMETIFRLAMHDENRLKDHTGWAYATITFVDILLKERRLEDARKVLIFFALEKDQKETEMKSSETHNLLALKKITKNLENQIIIEKSLETMEIVEYFLPNIFILTLKSKVLLETLVSSKQTSFESLVHQLNMFSKNNERHKYLREKIYELFVTVFNIGTPNWQLPSKFIEKVLSEAIEEFPENLLLLKSCATLQNYPWYKIRTLLMHRSSPVAFVFLFTSAQQRLLTFLESGAESMDLDTLQYSFKRRIFNILKAATNKSSKINQSPIIWRLFLRSSLEQQKSFDSIQRAFYAALDICPWVKDLYLDGSVLIPQEASRIQDLLVEKELRLYTLSEELEILRPKCN